MIFYCTVHFFALFEYILGVSINLMLPTIFLTTYSINEAAKNRTNLLAWNDLWPSIVSPLLSKVSTTSKSFKLFSATFYPLVLMISAINETAASLILILSLELVSMKGNPNSSASICKKWAQNMVEKLLVLVQLKLDVLKPSRFLYQQ